jgi:Fe-S-cluster containining protein
MMNIDFQCTQCGECCRRFRLPLSVEEAVHWLRDGNSVEILCEALPWVDEPPSSNLVAAFKRERSFPATSGTLPIRVIVTLVAPLGNRCPNLSEDNQCKIYERRPSTCRTYPAEVNPFIELVPKLRRCPPEAWLHRGEPLIREGSYVNPELIALIKGTLIQPVLNVPILEDLCKKLKVDIAAMVNEGYAVHSPTISALLEALTSARMPQPSESDWTFISNMEETVKAIRSCEAKCVYEPNFNSARVAYLSLFDKQTT